MSKQSMTEIANRSGKSVSTVSKVLRNCPGVDYETREAVRAAVCAGEPLASRREGNGICVILPDNPKFFWNRALAVLGGKNETLKIYSAMHRDREDREVSLCLSQAVEAGVSAVILAALPGEELREELARLADRMLILQLCEYTPIPNTFFVGSDFYEDGLALAEAVRFDGGQCPTVGVLRPNGSVSAIERVRGFSDGLGDCAEILMIDPPEASALYASHLARTIDGSGKKLDYLFGFDGVTASACDALYKLKDRMDCRYIGFEFPPTAQKHWENGRIAALAIQSPETQMRKALSLANRYVESGIFPDEKFTRLPSELRGTRFATF
ncbi:MAG: LacI family DNA-binding transcriptional regulator [Clostridia bacterium]|nr:LacI family DNA-binding transcriptional regulator [Clostridia bacterium]